MNTNGNKCSMDRMYNNQGVLWWYAKLMKEHRLMPKKKASGVGIHRGAK